MTKQKNLSDDGGRQAGMHAPTPQHTIANISPAGQQLVDSQPPGSPERDTPIVRLERRLLPPCL
jgi:hypothetical protein